jgi:hypothetical protein
LATLAGCRHTAPAATVPFRVALFPVQNLAGNAAPVHPLTDALQSALEQRGLDVVSRRELDDVLARNRIRFTAGLDRPSAKLLREELGVEGVVIPLLEQYEPGKPPRVTVGMRMVATHEIPTVLWADTVARTGDDSPGLLATGSVEKVSDLEAQVVSAAADAIGRWVKTRAPGDSCGRSARFSPRRAFRAPILDDVGRRTVAVLPFGNQTARRDADEVVLAEVLAQLVRNGSFEVLDPGVVREQILERRLIIEGGVSIDRAMTMLELLQADLVVSGDVRTFSSQSGTGLPPAVEFSMYAIDGATAELVWSSRSANAGEDGVFFFGAGRVRSASALSCLMARGIADRMAGDRGPIVAYGAKHPQRMRLRNATVQFQRQGRGATRQNLEQNARPDRARDVDPSRTPAAHEAAPKEPSR